MGWVDEVLNWVIPPILFLFIGWVMVKAFSPMTKGLGAWLGSIWEKIKGDGSGGSSSVRTINYE